MVHLIPFWQVWAAVVCTVHVALHKRPINQFQPLQQKRQQGLRAYCSYLYTVYEGAMVYRGLWEVQSALQDQADFDIEPFLHDRLNFYQVSNIIV